MCKQYQLSPAKTCHQFLNCLDTRFFSGVLCLLIKWNFFIKCYWMCHSLYVLHVYQNHQVSLMLKFKNCVLPSVCEIFYLSSFTVCYILITNLSRMSDNCLILPIGDIFLTFLIQKSFIEYTSVIRKWQFMDVFFVIDRRLLEDESYDFFYRIYTGFDPISATCRSIKATSLYIYLCFHFPCN